MSHRNGIEVTRSVSRVAALVLTGAAVLLAGCSAASTPGAGATPTGARPSGTSTAGTSSSPTSSTAEQLTAQILGASADSAPIASVKGDLTVLSDRFPAVAEVLEVRADATGTLLRWQLRSAAGLQINTLGFGLSRPPLFDTRGVALRDRAGKQVLSPFTFAPQKDADDTGCVCSGVPSAIGDDAEPMYALYPPLSAGATTVDVLLPGFAVATSVPVTRR